MVRIISQRNNIYFVVFIMLSIFITGCNTNTESEKNNLSTKIESNLYEKPTFIDFYSDT